MVAGLRLMQTIKRSVYHCWCHKQ